MPDGSRRRRQIVRQTEQAAREEAQAARRRAELAGELGCGLSSSQLADAAAALSLLKGQTSLVQCAAFYAQHHASVKSCTLADLYARVLSDMAARQQRGEIGRRHIETFRAIGRRFAQSDPSRLASACPPSDIEEWLDREFNGSAVSRRNALRYVSIMFQWAQAHDIVADNPAAKIKAPRIHYKTPAFLPVADVEALLREAEVKAPAVVPRVAIGFFAGLRSSELEQLKPEHIHLDAGYITVDETIAKSRIPRIVEILPNLAAWLRGRADLGPQDFAQRWRRASSRAIPANVLRHTYATYHLARFQDAGLTAKELGHTSGVKLLYQHYAHSGVTKTEAMRYWGIEPNATA